jgi:hypothetical protein
MIRVGTRVRLRSTGVVVSYWHEENDHEPDQPLDVPFPYVVQIDAIQYLLRSEDELEVIEP